MYLYIYMQTICIKRCYKNNTNIENVMVSLMFFYCSCHIHIKENVDN